MSVALAIEAYNADLNARSVRRPTIKKYRQLFDRLHAFAEEHGIVLLRQWTVPAARDFRATWNVSAITSNKMMERFRAFFRFCVDSAWIDKNPASALKRAKEDHLPTLPFTPAEMVAILRAADERRAGRTGFMRDQAERLRALVLVMRWSGLRISDAVMLRCSQLEEDTILLPTQTKTGVPVRVPMPPEVFEALESFPTPGEFFFAAGENHETQTGRWRRRLKRLFTLAKVANAHPHRFRDTFAVDLLKAGVPMERVSILLGHSSIKTTERHYAPWVKDRQDQLESDVRKTWGTKNVQISQAENQSLPESTTCEMVSRAGLAPRLTGDHSQVVVSTKRH